MKAYYDRRAPEYDDFWLGAGLYAHRDRPDWEGEVRALGAERDGTGNPLFEVMFSLENAPGGALELLERLRGKIGHVHLIDSDNTLHNNETSTHAPFGQGVLNFDALIPALLRSGVPTNWWTIDLCFWPNAWEVTADAKVFLDRMAQKYATAASA